jgi:release factor glutamine methyltransferase
VRILSANPTTLLARTLASVRRRIARPVLHGLRRPLVLSAMAAPSEVNFLGHRLRTAPGVFHPLYFSSSRILAEEVLRCPLRDVRILDMGTGAGPAAVALAAAGAKVTACDINPEAVAVARANARLNGLDAEVLESDLFAALPSRRFDVVCFNIPFYARKPATILEAAYAAGSNLETVRRFARDCPNHLAEGGRVAIVFSEDCDQAAILDAFEESGLCLASKTVVRKLLEDFHVAWFRRKTSAPGNRGLRASVSS